MDAGEIFEHHYFYRDPGTRAWQRKYFVVLAVNPAGDIVARLLTSRPHERPEQPPCFHGPPYPGFYLGVIGGCLVAKSWVDLRYLDDLDAMSVERDLATGTVIGVGQVSRSQLIPLLECAAAADDTTRMQSRAILDALSRSR